MRTQTQHATQYPVTDHRDSGQIGRRGRSRWWAAALLIGAVGSIAFTAQAADSSPVGRWQTIDDASGKPKAIVVIEEQGGVLSGRIVEIFPDPGADPDPKCDVCPGERKGKPIVGMTILEGLKAGGENLWDGGEILDPKNGKTYKALARLKQNGQNLEVRGFLGISLLGRTQVWHRQAP